jgi:hypothetical protein
VAPIPKPEVLDPDRPLRHHGSQLTDGDRPREELLNIALHESRADANQLWEDLNAPRQYPLGSLPADPHNAPGPVPVGAAPTGPDDQIGWQNWMDASAAVTSALSGHPGESGFGLRRDREQAQRRRATAPELSHAASNDAVTVRAEQEHSRTPAHRRSRQRHRTIRHPRPRGRPPRQPATAR